MNCLEVVLSLLMIMTMIVVKSFLEQPANLTFDSFDIALQALFSSVASICGIFLAAALFDVLTRGWEGQTHTCWCLGTNIDPAQLLWILQSAMDDGINALLCDLIFVIALARIAD